MQFIILFLIRFENSTPNNIVSKIILYTNPNLTLINLQVKDIIKSIIISTVNLDILLSIFWSINLKSIQYVPILIANILSISTITFICSIFIFILPILFIIFNY